MHRLRALAAPLALACGLSAVLTACGDDDEPTVAPAPTSEATSATTSESASDSPTVVPAGETAREFVKRWVELTALIQETGDVAPYVAISGADCRACHDFAQQVKDIYRRGGWIKTGEGRVIQVADRGHGEWHVELDSKPTRYQPEPNADVEKLPGGRHGYIVYLVKGPNGWVIGDLVNKAL